MSRGAGIHERLHIWGDTDPGQTREHNEDTVFPHSGRDSAGQDRHKARVSTQGQLCAVADGMGGGGRGRTASQLAIEALLEAYYEGTADDPGANLRAAVHSANAAVHSWASQAVTGDAGTTITAALFLNDYVYVANAGDSRTYILRNGSVVFKTRDHSLVQQWVDSGQLTAQQAAVHPDRNMITRSLGGRADIDIDLTRHFVRPGDVLVLCSDGLSGHVSDQEILNIATGNRPQKAAKKLIDLANRRGGTDNISVIVVRVPGRPARERTARQRKASQALVLGSMGLVLVGIAAALVLVLNPELYRRDGAVEPSATPTLAEQTTTEALPTATPTLTPTHTPTLVPTSTRAPTLTFTPTPEPPTDTPTPEPTATPQHTPTHTPVSEETPTNTPEP